MSSVCKLLGFHEMHAFLRGPNNLLYKYNVGPNFPSLADEIAKQRPEMNIKVASFTVSEKSTNMYPTYLKFYMKGRYSKIRVKQPLKYKQNKDLNEKW